MAVGATCMVNPGPFGGEGWAGLNLTPCLCLSVFEVPRGHSASPPSLTGCWNSGVRDLQPPRPPGARKAPRARKAGAASRTWGSGSLAGPRPLPGRQLHLRPSTLEPEAGRGFPESQIWRGNLIFF